MRETIEIDFQEKFSTTIPCIESELSERYRVYLAIISGELLADCTMSTEIGYLKRMSDRFFRLRDLLIRDEDEKP